MPLDQSNQMMSTPYKILNASITTNDPLTASVLNSARSVRRLNAILGMMLEAYLATSAGQVMAAQQLRIPVEELAGVKPAVTTSPAHASAAQEKETGTTSPSKSSLNFDKICA